MKFVWTVKKEQEISREAIAVMAIDTYLRLKDCPSIGHRDAAASVVETYLEKNELRDFPTDCVLALVNEVMSMAAML